MMHYTCLYDQDVLFSGEEVLRYGDFLDSPSQLQNCIANKPVLQSIQGQASSRSARPQSTP